jgi:TonB family protein
VVEVTIAGAGEVPLFEWAIDKRNWYAKMPGEAKQNRGKGKVVLRFRILKSGALDEVPTVEVSSGNKALDNAAVAAGRAATPFERLPESFKGPNIELRLIFLYNTICRSRR